MKIMNQLQKSGMKFLIVSAENFGNVFIFSILPTVIFFAALT